jgi:hypothetical protein
MKIRGSDGQDNTANECNKYQYDWGGWSTEGKDGDDSADLSPANQKLEQFDNTPFQFIRVCSGDEHATQGGSRCYVHNFGKAWKSALEMFSECGKSRARTVDGKNCQVRNNALKIGMIRTFGISGQRDCNMQLPGFSQVANDDARHRWGFSNNIPQQNCTVLV